MVSPRVARSPSGRPGDDGSAIVLAIVLAGIVMILGGGVVARSIGAVEAARGTADRTSARVVAEWIMEGSIRSLASGDPHRSLRDRAPLTLSADDPSGAVVRVEPGSTPDEHRIEVEARVGSAVHTAVASVRPFLSADHALLLEHRVIDPSLLQLPRAACPPPGTDLARADACLDGLLGPATVTGPIHVREGIATLPATSSAAVTTSLLRTGSDGAPEPTLEGSGAPSHLVVEHRSGPALPRDVATVRGDAVVTCRFRGPTAIRFVGTGIRVRSPLSVPREGESATTLDAVGCQGVDRDLLADMTSIPLPQDAVIEVVRDASSSCLVHPLGIPDEDAERPWACADGSAFVWGRYLGRRTVLAQDHIQVAWDLEPGDASGPVGLDEGDLLGLVAGDSVVLRRTVGRPIRRIAPLGPNIAFAGPGLPPFGDHPEDAPAPTATTWDRPRIVASLAALGGSVTLQNPFRGQPHAGPLVIIGSVAARFPGIFAWEERTSLGALVGATGYPLEIHHDVRLLTDAPPLLPITDPSRVRVIYWDVG